MRSNSQAHIGLSMGSPPAEDTVSTVAVQLEVCKHSVKRGIVANTEKRYSEFTPSCPFD